MKLLRYIFYYALFSFCFLPAIEYTYPVACLDDGVTILFIHQLSTTRIQLFQLNTQTDQIEPILWSLFNPAAMQLLPDRSGFSFIDNGRLRIKRFNKRSPKAIDFSEPLFNINSLCWLDSNSCYCSAQQGNAMALFELHDDGTARCLAHDKKKDFLYPQKIDNHLFYIERDKNNNVSSCAHHIMQMTYPKDERHAQARMIINFNDKPIAFLDMKSYQEGFVLEHNQIVDSRNENLLFLYHRIIKKERVWKKELLFSFSIPAYLLIQGNQEQLHESILPLLPRSIDNKIYFVDNSMSATSHLELYAYDMSRNAQEKVILPTEHEGHVFVPMLCGDEIYYGGTKHPENSPLFCFLT